MLWHAYSITYADQLHTVNTSLVDCSIAVEAALK